MRLQPRVEELGSDMTLGLGIGFARFGEPIRVESSGFVKGVDDAQEDRRAVSACIQRRVRPAGPALRREVFGSRRCWGLKANCP